MDLNDIFAMFAPQEGAYGMTAPGSAPMAFAPESGPPAGIDPSTIPMPRPRPDVDVLTPQAVEAASRQPPQGPMGGLEMLAGADMGRAGGMPSRGGGLLQTLIGDPDRARSIKAALAGGLAGMTGNTAGAAIGRGIGGGFQGAAKSEREDLNDRLSVLDRAIKARSSGTDEEYKGALTDYTRARTNNALNGTTPTGRGTVQSPFQKWAEIERRSPNAQKRFLEQFGAGSPTLRPEEAKARRQQADDAFKAWRDEAYRRAGIDPANPPKQDARNGAAAPAENMEMKGNGTNSEPYEPSSQDDYGEIPSGAYYRHPDGSVRLKK